MDRLFTALADPTIHAIYLGVCISVMVVPMIALSWWYRRAIRRTPGGRALMQSQEATDPDGRPPWEVLKGAFGPDAARLTRLAIVTTLIWLLAVALLFGLLIWADEVNRASAL